MLCSTKFQETIANLKAGRTAAVMDQEALEAWRIS